MTIIYPSANEFTRGSSTPLKKPRAIQKRLHCADARSLNAAQAPWLLLMTETRSAPSTMAHSRVQNKPKERYGSRRSGLRSSDPMAPRSMSSWGYVCHWRRNPRLDSNIGQ